MRQIEFAENNQHTCMTNVGQITRSRKCNIWSEANCLQCSVN